MLGFPTLQDYEMQTLISVKETENFKISKTNTQWL